MQQKISHVPPVSPASTSVVAVNADVLNKPAKTTAFVARVLLSRNFPNGKLLGATGDKTEAKGSLEITAESLRMAPSFQIALNPVTGLTYERANKPRYWGRPARGIASDLH